MENYNPDSISSLCVDSAEDVLKVCPQCPLLAPLNDTKVVHAVEVALTAFNTQSNGSYFQLVEVSRAQHVVRRRPSDSQGGLVALGGMQVVKQREGTEQVQRLQRGGKVGGEKKERKYPQEYE